VKPGLYRLHERIGTAWLMEHRPREALAEFEAEKRAASPSPVADLRMGQALQALGRLEQAREAYRRALAFEPGAAEARDSLAALGGR
jgi:tetratricopeptide (TPR) repeat protein